jgi:[ribosomal protein S5]-alanine N-acetyltransferase
MNRRVLVPFPTLTTERLELRKLLGKDSNEIYELRTDDRVNLYLDRDKPENIQDAVNFIHYINKGIEEDKSVYWAICSRTSPRLLGTICLWNFSDEEHSAEIGFELSPSAQGKGLMNEAIRAVIHYAFSQISLGRLEAFTRKENSRSIRLLEKNNFILQTETPDENNQLNRIYSLRNESRYFASQNN